MRTKPTQHARKPVHRITRGKVEVAIWERSGQKGRFYQASFSRPYRSQDGSQGASESFGLGQLADLTLAAAEAFIWMESQARPRLRNGNGESDDFGEDTGDYVDAEM